MAQFDQSPTPGDEHYEGDVTWEYDGTKWVKQSPVVKTENVVLTDTTHPANISSNPLVLPEIPPDTTTQFGANQYYMAALSELDDVVAGIHVGDSAPTEYSNGTLWYNSTADVEKLYIYYDPTETLTGTWVETTPLDLTDVNDAIGDVAADFSALTDRVEDKENDISTLQGTTAGHTTKITDLENSVSDILTTENTQQGQIDTLENKVEALEGAVIDAKYTLSTRTTPNEGEFALLSATDSIVGTWAVATKILFHETDDNGNPHTFDTIGLDDFVRIGGLMGAAVYKIKSQRGGSSPVYEFDVEIVSSSDSPFATLQYDFEFTPGFDASAYATVTYVDDQDALKVNKSGDTMTGKLILSSSGQANDDGVRFYMKDLNNSTNLTIFPSGLLQSSNTIRVNKDTGDAFQVKDATGSTVSAKIHSDGHVETPKIYLTGGGADIDERVIDVKQGQSGRLSYSNATRMSWGANNVWIGTTTTTGEAQTSVNLDLQGNPITNVGTFTLNHTGQTTGNKFVIKGETDDGMDTDVFYSYKNNDGTTDAVNYKGRMTNEFNLVNKGYVDTQFASVSTDTLMPKAGGTFTGEVTYNNSGNQQINFNKSGNNDIRYRGDWIVSFQGNASPTIKLNTTVDCNDNYLANVKDPASDRDAVNRRSLVGAKVAATSSGSTTSGGFYYSNGRLFYKI